MASVSFASELNARNRWFPGGKPLRQHLLARVSLVLGCVFLAPGALLLRPFFSSNLGIVDPGRVIRAAQPTTQLPALIKEHHLASILNLRGGSGKDWWYKAEVKIAGEQGVAFYDLPMGATRRPTRTELLRLIDVIDHCAYPLLIHCKSGADRTGLATAIYLMLARGEGPDQALRGFSLSYSHVPLFGPEHLHEPLEEYKRWLIERSLHHTAGRFRSWVRNEYRSEDIDRDPPPVIPGPRHPL